VTRPNSEDPAPEGFFGRPDVDWCWSLYLTGLPPALVVTAGLDPLCEDGAVYAARLREAGIPAELVRFAEMPHGFFSPAGALDEAEEAQLAVVRALQEASRAGRV
jgi:acetyl esterase